METFDAGMPACAKAGTMPPSIGIMYFSDTGNTCPTDNILLTRGVPVFNRRCALCFRCVYGCPARAIKLRVFRCFVLDEWYDLERIAGDVTIDAAWLTDRTRGFYRRFYKFLGRD
ncbi:MAG: hypothetical protein ACM3ZC_09810 [Bacteroidota bacterium]